MDGKFMFFSYCFRLLKVLYKKWKNYHFIRTKAGSEIRSVDVGVDCLAISTTKLYGSEELTWVASILLGMCGPVHIFEAHILSNDLFWN